MTAQKEEKIWVLLSVIVSIVEPVNYFYVKDRMYQLYFCYNETLLVEVTNYLLF